VDAPSDPQAVERVLATARLARLELGAERAAELAPQFARILEAFGRLAALDLDGRVVVPPGDGPRDVTREDRPHAGLSREEFLAAAPERTAEHLRVPRAVGRST
jgi:aspartyl/glutamyl-tRNA(Asn/Gln) amidotransferase C subunit